MTLRVSASFGSRLTHSVIKALALPGPPSAENATQFSNFRLAAFEETLDPDRFAWEYLREQVLSKYDDGDPNNAKIKRLRAYDDLQKSESACMSANARLVDWASRAHLDKAVWLRARALCERILGKFNYNELPFSCNFGPGASTGIPRSRAAIQNKWALAAHVTEPALPYVSAFVSWAGMRQLHRFCKVVEGNKVTTVPKNWKKDRLIAIEPDWNLFLQKGVGKMIRRRLQNYGQLHRDSQSVNSGMARLGSATGEFATLDLSRASDSVSLALCEALLPPSWFAVLCDLRSPVGRVEGVLLSPYEKISSMGNGTTFELETLLFYVLVCASCRKDEVDRVFVYGDDIICPTRAVEKVFETLFAAGFELNTDKSFWTGDFRESCGGHWFRGRDVSPFYLKQDPSHVGDLCNLGNEMTKFVHNRSPGDPQPFTEAYNLIKRSVPRKYRGPLGYDGVLWSNWDESSPTWIPAEQRYAQAAFTKRPRGYKHVPYRSGALLAALWNARSSDDDEEVRMSRLPRREYCFRSSQLAVDRDSWSPFTGIS